MAFHAMFDIGVMKRLVEQELWAPEAYPRDRVASAQKGRMSAAEARRVRELEICKKHGWSLDGEGLAARLADKLGAVKRTGKPVPFSTIRLDLRILKERERATTS